MTTRLPWSLLLLGLLILGCPDEDPFGDDDISGDDDSGDDDSAADDDATGDDDSTGDDDTGDDDTTGDDDSTGDDDTSGDDDSTGDDDTTSASLSDADAILLGEAADDHAGVAADGAGDLNNDGFGDVVVGADGHDVVDGDEGAAYLFFGPLSGTQSLDVANAKLTGEAAGDRAGNSVAGLGDTNSDGFDDVLIGAYRESAVLEHAGAAYLVQGPVVGEVSLNTATAKLLGEAADDWAGSAVAAAGDVNDDGRADLLVAAYRESSVADQAGAVYLFHGPVSGSLGLGEADAKLTGVSADDWAGTAVAAAGDVNGDGYDDVLVGATGASGYTGVAYLVHGPISGSVSLSSADAAFSGEIPGDYAGVSVAGAGDTNGDGYDDLLVGSAYNDAGAGNAGVAYLMLGPQSGTNALSGADTRLLGQIPDGFAGIALDSAGDVDGDGRDDVLVGASNDGTMGFLGGAAYLVNGPPAGTFSLAFADAQLFGVAANDWAGRAVAGAGDVDHDGRGDLLICAPREDTGGADAGAVYLFYGGNL